MPKFFNWLKPGLFQLTKKKLYFILNQKHETGLEPVSFKFSKRKKNTFYFKPKS